MSLFENGLMFGGHGWKCVSDVKKMRIHKTHHCFDAFWWKSFHPRLLLSPPNPPPPVSPHHYSTTSLWVGAIWTKKGTWEKQWENVNKCQTKTFSQNTSKSYDMELSPKRGGTGTPLRICGFPFRPQSSYVQVRKKNVIFNEKYRNGIEPWARITRIRPHYFYILSVDVYGESIDSLGFLSPSK